MTSFILKHLHTNTVLDGSVILCVCSFSVETTFPLSNFQTYHILGILIVLRKHFFLPQSKTFHMGRPRRPIFFLAETTATAVVSQMGAEGGAPPEGEGNAAEGSYFVSIIYINEYVIHGQKLISFINRN